MSQTPASTSKPSSPPPAAKGSAAAPAAPSNSPGDSLFFSQAEYERQATSSDVTMEEALKAFDKAFKKARARQPSSRAGVALRAYAPGGWPPTLPRPAAAGATQRR